MAAFENPAFDPFASPAPQKAKPQPAAENPFAAYVADENFPNEPRTYDIADMLASPKAGVVHKAPSGPPAVPPTPENVGASGFISPKLRRPSGIEFAPAEGDKSADPFAPPSPMPASRKKELSEQTLSPRACRASFEISNNDKLSEPARALAQASMLHAEGAISSDEKAQLKDLILKEDSAAAKALAALTQAGKAMERSTNRDLGAEAMRLLADALSRAPALQLHEFVTSVLPIADTARGRVRCQLALLSGGKFALVHEGSQTVVLRAYKKGLLRPTFRIALCGTACVVPRNDARINRLIGEDGSISKLHASPVGDAYTLHDMGEKPENAAGVMHLRKELAVCEYVRVLGTGPRKLSAAVPSVPPPDSSTGAAGGAPAAWRPRKKDETMLTALHARRADGLTRLTQREPTWNEQLKSYQLDFDGRCALADDCNCILECEYAGAEAGKACAGPQVAFLLGRVDLKRGAAHRERALGRKEAADVKAVYSLDVAYPLSLVQAFGIALTQLNSSSIFDCR